MGHLDRHFGMVVVVVVDWCWRWWVAWACCCHACRGVGKLLLLPYTYHPTRPACHAPPLPLYTTHPSLPLTSSLLPSFAFCWFWDRDMVVVGAWLGCACGACHLHWVLCWWLGRGRTFVGSTYFLHFLRPSLRLGLPLLPTWYRMGS